MKDTRHSAREPIRNTMLEEFLLDGRVPHTTNIRSIRAVERNAALEEAERAMERVMAEHKGALDYAEDGRYTWPERWDALAAAIRALKEVE